MLLYEYGMYIVVTVLLLSIVIWRVLCYASWMSRFNPAPRTPDFLQFVQSYTCMLQVQQLVVVAGTLFQGVRYRYRVQGMLFYQVQGGCCCSHITELTHHHNHNNAVRGHKKCRSPRKIRKTISKQKQTSGGEARCVSTLCTRYEEGAQAVSQCANWTNIAARYPLN